MTVHEIAKLANVSVATVSRVMNNTGTVKPETAEVVRRAMEKLGADHGGTATLAVRRGPRQGARARQALQTTIAIVSLGQEHGTWFQMPVLSQVIRGITREASERGLIVQIEDGRSADEVGTTLRARGVSGALTFVPSGVNPDVLKVLARHVPVVRVMGEGTAAEGVDHVCPDNAAVGALAVQYLADRGCRHVAFMTANPGWDLNYTRAVGFHSRAITWGLAAPSVFIVPSGDLDRERYWVRTVARPSLEALVDAFIATSPRPAGLFVPRDEETVAVYRLLLARGVIPGRDVTLISCDNEEMRLSGLDPRPASIELGTVEIGQWAVRRLLSRMRRPHDPAVKMLAAPRVVPPDELNAASAAV